MDISGTMSSTKLYLTFVFLTFCNQILKLAANQCVQLLNDKCRRELGSYNATKFPNFLGHSDYPQAEIEFNQFLPLIDSVCSPSLLPFLCSAYFPRCEQQTSGFAPCATECVKSFSRCWFLFSFYGFKWPNSLSCDRFADGKHCPRKSAQTCKDSVSTSIQSAVLSLSKVLSKSNISTFILYYSSKIIYGRFKKIKRLQFI
jgi:hypothetical protein